MHSTGSILYTIVDRVKHLVDHEDTTRFSNNYIVTEMLMPSFVQLWARLNMDRDDPILMQSTISLAANTKYYVLPPAVARIMRLVKFSTDGAGRVTYDWLPGQDFSFWGPGWLLDGNELRFEPVPTKAEDWTLLYVPSGDVAMHYGTGVVSGTSSNAIVLDALPTLGELDRRENAYAGMTIRVLEDGHPIQERIISSYNQSTRVATVRTPFTSLPANGADVDYEIAPRLMQPMVQALALMICMDHLAVSMGLSERRLRLLDDQLHNCMKTINDTVSAIQARVSKSWERDTVDNPLYYDPSGMVVWGN